MTTMVRGCVFLIVFLLLLVVPVFADIKTVVSADPLLNGTAYNGYPVVMGNPWNVCHNFGITGLYNCGYYFRYCSNQINTASCTNVWVSSLLTNTTIDGTVSFTPFGNSTAKWIYPVVQCKSTSYWMGNTTIDSSAKWHWDYNSSEVPPSSNMTPNCLFSANTTNLSIVPSWLGLSPAFPQNLSSYEWDVVGFEKEYYSTGLYPMWNITVPDTYRVTFTAFSNSSDSCVQTMDIPFWQNRTTPSINVSGNITPPNWSPIIPTLPTGIPILPDSLNRTHIRDQINNTILGNVSAEYMNYWDEVYEGLVDMITDILDVIFSPLIYVLDSLKDAEAWIETITNQYSTSSANVWYFILQAIYSIHPKIANLITYELFLGLIVVVMHELKVKK